MALTKGFRDAIAATTLLGEGEIFVNYSKTKFTWENEHVRTNGQLARLTVELASQDNLIPFFAFVDKYTKFNSNGMNNLITQVAYCLGSEEVQIVQRAANRYKEAFKCVG